MKRALLVSIVIPCLNEKETIKKCVLDAKKFAKKYLTTKFEIIVADNGSQDGTLNILKKIKSIKVINVPLKGYGAALHWGILNSKASYILFADADLSYPFSNLNRFIDLLKLKPDLILGTRIKGTIEKNSMPFLHRYFGTPILTFLIKTIYKIPTTDCNSGMRLVKKKFYLSLGMRNSGMEWASELLIRTALKNGKYVETPIDFKKDKRRTRPHLATWSDGWRHLKSILLLKPSSLFPVLVFFVFLTITIFSFNQLMGLFFSSITFTLLFSTLAAQFIDDHLNTKETFLYRFLKEFMLVPLVGLSSLIAIGIVWFMPSNLFIVRIFILNSLAIIFIWVFLIETIKTHLVKRLPD